MSWTFKYRFNGRQEKLVIGRYPDLTLKKAREMRDKLSAQVAEGRSPAEEKRKLRQASVPDSEVLTVRGFGQRYYDEQVAKNWEDPSGELRYLEKDLYPALGDRPLKGITALEVQSVVYPKRDGGHASAAICLRNTIKRMYDYAVELQLATINPAAMVATRYIGKATRRSRHLTSKEIREYLHVIYRSNIGRQFKLALHILLLTLARKSMLLLATWDEIDYSTGEWTIPKEHMKGKKGEEHEHTVYMSRQVAAMFRELKGFAGGSRFVLPGRGKQNQPFAKNALNKALEGLTFEMEPFTIHDQRMSADPNPKTILRVEEVLRRTGLKRTMLYDLIRKRSFPAQFSLGARAVGWYEDEVEAWIRNRHAASRKPERLSQASIDRKEMKPPSKTSPGEKAKASSRNPDQQKREKKVMRSLRPFETVVAPSVQLHRQSKMRLTWPQRRASPQN